MVGGSPGTTASSTTKTGHHDMAEILLKVALKPQRSKTKKSFETLPSTTIFDISAWPCLKIIFVQKAPILKNHLMV